MPSTRIFIGNLTADAQENDIKKKFSSYGIINKIDIKNKLDIEGNPISRFAYLNLEAGQENLNKCIQNTNGSKLKGSVLKVEIAKESFLDRLKKEREQGNQPKDFNSDKEISFNYNFKNTNLAKFDKKEYNFKNSSLSSGNFNSYNNNENSNSSGNFNNYNNNDNFNSSSNFNYYDNNDNFKSNFENSNDDYENFENSNDDYENFENYSSHRDNNNRSLGLHEDKNDTHILSSFKRYYPPTSEKKGDKKLNSEKGKSQNKFVHMHSELNFKEGVSSFSLLEKFSEIKPEIKEEIDVEQDAIISEPSHSTTSRIMNDTEFSVKPKPRKFFVSADHPLLEEAVSWILTPLTEENQKEFDLVKDSLTNTTNLRNYRAKRDPYFVKNRKMYLRMKY